MNLKVERLSIPDVILVAPARFTDSRGSFSETYNRQRFAAAGIDFDFIQDNHSVSQHVHTIRGLHFQAPPFAQTKLVRCVRGSITDIAVDARRGSPTFGHWVKAELSAENGVQILVPRGFLHGFVTREPDTEVIYKVDQYYSGEHDGSVIWNDADLGIDWGLGGQSPVLSAKDANAMSFSAFDTPFTV